jgi:tetratricopeptide (TPR) repeat protein
VTVTTLPPRAARVAASLLLAAEAASCRRGSPAPATLPPLARDLLALAHDFPDDARRDAARAEADAAPAALAALGARTKAALARGGPAAAIVATIFDDGAFVREVDDKDLRYVLLPSVLAARRGSCVGLGTLALALAELANVPARGVVAPGHFYVEIGEGDRWRRVELLRRGEELPDDWYRARYGTPGHAVSAREVLGIVAYDVGNERRRQGRLADARRAFERAVADFPSFAEAQASLGAALQLEGALDAAAAAYARARALDPALPGLARNIELLEAERARLLARDR